MRPPVIDGPGWYVTGSGCGIKFKLCPAYGGAWLAVAYFFGRRHQTTPGQFKHWGANGDCGNELLRITGRCADPAELTPSPVDSLPAPPDLATEIIPTDPPLCPKCESSEVRVYLGQDAPNLASVTCRDCGHRILSNNVALALEAWIATAAASAGEVVASDDYHAAKQDKGKPRADLALLGFSGVAIELLECDTHRGPPAWVTSYLKRESWMQIAMHCVEATGWVAVAEVSTMGAEKYSADSWKNVPDGVARYQAAFARHLAAHLDGEDLDPESGLPHAAHCAWNACAVAELEGGG